LRIVLPHDFRGSFAQRLISLLADSENRRKLLSEGGHDMKVIAFASDNGGMGKSTAAVNLACAATEDGFEVAILDLEDPQASARRGARIRKKKSCLRGLRQKPASRVISKIASVNSVPELTA
jgi:Mrp family chromosome partitioning ATPase